MFGNLKFMDLIDVFSNVPAGKFRLIGRDNFEETYFIVGEYGSEIVAIAEQINNEGSEEALNGKPNEIASTFYVINDKGGIIYPHI